MHRAILSPRSPCSSPAPAARRVAPPIRARRISPRRCSENTTGSRTSPPSSPIPTAAVCSRRRSSERGRLLVKKPGKMRWQYTAPEQKLFVSDGVKMYSYIPQDKQVIVTSIPPDDQITTPTMFLAGKGNLTRDFSASIVEPPAGAPAGTRALKLVPKTAAARSTTGCCSRSRPRRSSSAAWSRPTPRAGYRAFLSPT